jgi:hypothetical protein
MGIIWNSVRVCIAALIVVVVADVSGRAPRLGAVLLSLPLISILSFSFSWFQHRDLRAISSMAKDTLVLVPLGLPFFVPFVFAPRLGWNYWGAFIAGVLLATFTIGCWLMITAD